MSDAKAAVEQLSKDGVSLHAIIMSEKYSEVVRVEALRVLHMNVRDLRAYDKETPKVGCLSLFACPRTEGSK